MLSRRSRRPKQEKTKNFLENGSMLQEKLLSFSNGKYSPIRRFSTQEVIHATNNFDPTLVIATNVFYNMYKSSLGYQLVSVKKWSSREYAVQDIVTNTQMNKHKYVGKLLGCCLDFQFPVSVYEYPAGSVILSHCLPSRRGSISGGVDDQDFERIMCWKSRLRIANQIANVITYLHTALPQAVIHRDLKPSGIIVDQLGVARLFDFSVSIAIPAGETRVQDNVYGSYGYLDPEYMNSGYASCKSDTYSFGIFLLILLTGQNVVRLNVVGSHHSLPRCVQNHGANVELDEILDPRILSEGRGSVTEQQLKAFLALALRCIQEKGEDRPDMIDVAKELRQIERSV